MKLFSLLSRYVSRSFLKSFGATMVGLFIIILLFDFLEIQKRTGSKDVSLINKLTMVVLRSPYLLEQAVPFIVFLSALFVFWQMNRSHELVIFRAMGISLWRLIVPISLTALVIGGLDLTTFNPLSSVMLERYEKLEKKYLSGITEDVKVESTGLWLSEKMGPNQAIYRASHIDLNALEFKNLSIIILSPQNTFLERIDAKMAQIQGNQLKLTEGWDTQAGKPAQSFLHKYTTTSLTQKKIEKMNISKNSLSFWRLPAYISLLNASGLKSVKYLMYWHSLISSVFLVGAMVVLAAAFSCRPQRQGKTILMILAGLIVGFFLYFFKDVTFALGVSGRLPPVIAAWLPPLLTLMVGAVLVFNQEDG
jgi:lipopolysaccharide export system permease protein